MLSFVSFFVLSACDTQMAPATNELEAAVVYGIDNRKETYEFPGQAVQDLINGVAVVLDQSFLSNGPNGTYDIDTSTTLAQYADLCNGEPFASQPVPGECTAFLVAPDVIVTAGHCIANNSCARTRFVFDFELTAPNVVRTNFPASAVYSCSQIIARETRSSDYAVVRLDRTVAGRLPLPVSTAGVSVGDGVALIGHPDGIPMKVAAGGQVKWEQGTYFEASVDSFGGNSGSPVISTATREVVGILVSGNNDYVQRGNCFVRNVCSGQNGCQGSWEGVTGSLDFEALIP